MPPRDSLPSHPTEPDGRAAGFARRGPYSPAPAVSVFLNEGSVAFRFSPGIV